VNRERHTEEAAEQLLRDRARRWAARLREEYDHVCFSHRIELARPALAVTELGTRWGTWDPFTRTLSLSTRLLEEYPWEIVVEVLKHEMAHQLADERFGADEAHGPLFRQACRALGVAEWAQRAEVELGEALVPFLREGNAGGTGEDRLLRRVEKLLALAGSSNEHEASAAMGKVRELYAKYNLERIRDHAADPMVSLFVRTGRRRLERYQYLICSILNDHFFVEVVHTELYDTRRCEPYKAVELLGTRENVLMAEYVYHFLMNHARLLWEQHARQRPSSGGRKSATRRSTRSAFQAGVIRGFLDRLEAERPKETPAAAGAPAAPGTWLVVPPDPALDAYVAYRYPRLVRIRNGGRMLDRASYESGRQEGRALVLHKGVTTQGPRGKLLPG
jgi:hypothetical protein